MSQWKRDHGSRSSRAGIAVLIVRLSAVVLSTVVVTETLLPAKRP
jgi:hypothetical protein